MSKKLSIADDEKSLHTRDMKCPILPGDLYCHYKGGVYQILEIATHSETCEALILYRAYGLLNPHLKNTLWARPLEMWFERVHVTGNDLLRVRPELFHDMPEVIHREAVYDVSRFCRVDPSTVHEVFRDTRKRGIKTPPP